MILLSLNLWHQKQAPESLKTESSKMFLPMQTAIEKFKNNDFDNSDTNFKSNKGVKYNVDVRES